jgi:hypothetical protein
MDVYRINRGRRLWTGDWLVAQITRLIRWLARLLHPQVEPTSALSIRIRVLER